MQSLQVFEEQKQKLKDPNTSIDMQLEIIKLIANHTMDSQNPLKIFIQSDILPVLIDIYNNENSTVELQQNILMIFCDVSSSYDITEIDYTIKQKVPQIIVPQICNDDYSITEVVSWVIGHVAKQGIEYRDFLLNDCQVIQYITNALDKWEEKKPKNYYKKNMAWSIRYLISGNPSIDYEICKKLLPYLLNFLNADNLFQKEEQEIIMDSIKSLYTISELHDQFIDDYINLGVLQKIIPYFQSLDEQILIGAIRIVGNISYFNQEVLLNSNIFEIIVDDLLDNTNDSIKMECFDILYSFIDKIQQIPFLCESMNFYTKTLGNIEEGNLKVKNKAMLLVEKLFAGDADEQKLKMITYDTVDYITNGMENKGNNNNKSYSIYLSILDYKLRFINENKEKLSQENNKYLKVHFKILMEQDWFLKIVQEDNEKQYMQIILKNIQKYFIDVEEIQKVCAKFINENVQIAEVDPLKDEQKQQLSENQIAKAIGALKIEE